MRTAIKFLVLATVVIAVAWWMMHLPGTVSAHIGDTTIAAPTAIALLAAILLFIVLYILVRLLGGLLRLPGRNRGLRGRRATLRGEAAMTRTLVALAAGDPVAAQREAQRSRELLGDTPQTLLFAAYAGRQAGRPEEAETAFKLLAGRRDTAFLGLRGLLQQALADGDVERAAELTQQAEAANPGSPWLRAERANVAIQAGDWKQALALSADDGMRASLAVAAADAETNASEGRRLAKQAWQAAPGFTPAAVAYARRLRDASKESAAQDVLRDAWGNSPNPALAALSMAYDADPARRVRRAEWLVAKAPDHAESRLLLAREYLGAGRAERALEQVKAAHEAGLDERRLWVLTAEIANTMGDREAEVAALEHVKTAGPDTVWRCGQCGTAHAAWRPVCSVCGTQGRIVWGRLDSGNAAQGRRMSLSEGDPILP